MKYLFILIPFLLSAQIIGGIDFTKMDSLTWYAVKINTFNDIAIGDKCGSPIDNILTDWSSAAYNWEERELWFCGGGHSSTWDNSLYIFDLDSMRFRVGQAHDTTLGYNCSEQTCYDSLSDGTPTSRHTYDALTYLPDPYSYMILVGGSRACGPGSGGDDTWGWTAAKGWHQKHDGSPVHFELVKSTQWNPLDSCVYMNDYGGLKKFDPSDSSWTTLKSHYLGYGRCAAIDTTRGGALGRMYIIGGNSEGDGYDFYYYDLANVAAGTTKVSTTGGSAIINIQAPAIEYDPVADMIVCFADGSVWTVSPDGGAWTEYDLTGKPADPSKEGGYTEKIYSHFTYMPEKNCYIFLSPLETDSVYFFKYKLAAGEWNARSTQSDVVYAFDFDDSTDTRDRLHRSTSHENWDLGQWVDDIYASGGGSLRMTIPEDKDYGGTNDWKVNFGDSSLSLKNPELKFKGFNGTGGTGSDLGTDMWIQFRLRMDSTMLDNIWNLSTGRGGWKFFIVGEGDNYPWTWNHESPPSEEGSAQQNEIVGNNAELRGAPTFYHANPGFYFMDEGLNTAGESNYTDTTNSQAHMGHATDGIFQNAIDAGSQSHAFRERPLRQAYRDTVGEFGNSINYQYYTHPSPTDYPTILFHPDEWMTIMLAVNLGPIGTDASSIGGGSDVGWTQSRFRAWLAREDEEFVSIVDIDSIVFVREDGADTTTSNEGYGKIWLTTFHTGLDTGAANRDDAYMYYDELIISKDSIATPWSYQLGQEAAEGGNGNGNGGQTIQFTGGGQGRISGGGVGRID